MHTCLSTATHIMIYSKAADAFGYIQTRQENHSNKSKRHMTTHFLAAGVSAGHVLMWGHSCKRSTVKLTRQWPRARTGHVISHRSRFLALNEPRLCGCAPTEEWEGLLGNMMKTLLNASQHWVEQMEAPFLCNPTLAKQKIWLLCDSLDVR